MSKMHIPQTDGPGRSLIEFADLPDAVREAGFAFHAGSAMSATIRGRNAAFDWASFSSSWNDLGLDLYMADGGRYRRRRFAAYRITQDAVECKPHQPHYQSRDYNPLNGDIERWFEPIRPEIAEHPALLDLMEICRSVFNFPDDLARATPWHAEVHQFRIEARADIAGLPTPEGMHRDGVDWVCVVLVKCENVESGTTEIHDSRRDVTNRFTLVEALDTVFLDDIRMRHGVTPILPKDPALPGHRDVLVLTFRKESS